MASDTDALQQQRFQFSEPAFEQMQRALDWGSGRHVHTCSSQRFQRKFRAARAQKIQISLDRSWRAGEYPLRKRHGSRNPSRVFIDIERMIEMRDAQAFKINLGINDEVFGKIGFEELVVFRFKNVQRQRVAAILDGVDDFFELSKHGLPKQRTA